MKMKKKCREKGDTCSWRPPRSANGEFFSSCMSVSVEMEKNVYANMIPHTLTDFGVGVVSTAQNFSYFYAVTWESILPTLWFGTSTVRSAIDTHIVSSEA